VVPVVLTAITELPFLIFCQLVSWCISALIVEAMRCVFRDLFASGYAPGIHFYTLNREVAVISILKQVGLWSEAKVKFFPMFRKARVLILKV
jgi:hypothetical protein